MWLREIELVDFLDNLEILERGEDFNGNFERSKDY